MIRKIAPDASVGQRVARHTSDMTKQRERQRSSRLAALMLGLFTAGSSGACTGPRHHAPSPPAGSASAGGPAPEAAPHPAELIITSLSSLPGRALVEHKDGFYCRFFEYSGTGDYGERFRKALEFIRDEGKQQGANAFVHASVSSESHEIQGSKWHSSMVHICGDFVRLD
jgi:hypothetical protein